MCQRKLSKRLFVQIFHQAQGYHISVQVPNYQQVLVFEEVTMFLECAGLCVPISSFLVLRTLPLPKAFQLPEPLIVPKASSHATSVETPLRNTSLLFLHLFAP